MNQNGLFCCVNCASNSFTEIASGRDLLHDLPGEFLLMECSNCHLITTFPRLPLSDIEIYYPKDYLAFPVAIQEETNALHRIDRTRGLNRRCDFTVKHSSVRAGKILDIGCATGIFLKGMSERGWEAYGIEPNDYAARYAREKLGLNVHKGYLADNPFPNSTFDVVTLWDVFEHLPDPKVELDLISGLLKPGGKLIITTPNAASIDRYIFKDSWAGWDVPRHYNIFTPRTLTEIAARSAFLMKHIVSFTGRHGVVALSIKFDLKRRGVNSTLATAIEKVFRSAPLRLLTYPYFTVAEKLNLTSIMTGVFEKK